MLLIHLKQQLERISYEQTIRKDEKVKLAGGPSTRQDDEFPASEDVSAIGGYSTDQIDERKAHTATRVRQLELLKVFIETELGYYLELQSTAKAGLLTTIGFEDLWFLFQPGEVLYEKAHGYEQLLETYAVTGGQLRRRNRTEEENDRLRSDKLFREQWRPQRRRPTYGGDWNAESEDEDANEDSIVEASGIGTWNLPIYPLRFHTQKWDIAAKLEARGKNFINAYGHRMYSGLTLPLSRHGYQEELRGDIFVDLKTYYRTYSRRRPKLGMLQKSTPDAREVSESIPGVATWRMLYDHEVDEKITDEYMASDHTFVEPVNSELVQNSVEHLQLLPYRIPAFVFRTRVYVHVDISKIADIDKSDENRDRGFDDLIIPESHRELLIALVENHATGGTVEVDMEELNKTSTQIDIVRGKGRGLIILLHGPPGSGKTSTAETIAAYTRRPLYSITCGDLGSRVSEVEMTLREHTERAYRWGCVLLLDEADVFLTRRDWRDMERNGLVSVFLRELEYYSGILFLTTNRVGVLDEAFKSRIHISLRYPRIQQRETRQMWENILNRIERDNETSEIKIKFDREALLDFADKHYRKNEEAETSWNGRQIRNAFQTAIALGRHERDRRLRAAGMTAEDAARSGQRKWMVVKLTKANFRSIVRTASEFEDYLASVRGPDSSLAKENQLRDDTLSHGSGSGSGSHAAAEKAYYDPGRVVIPAARRSGGGGGSGSGGTRRGNSGGYLTPSFRGDPVAGKATTSRADSSVSHKRRSVDEDESDDEDEDLSDENLSDD
ncbi:hypothetical protein SLS62_008756 [Diatrype stigma]|uniref:AAA+ ATPase domain-containing protein n=1 Tax=Diatrype stigma TaxID=117547 RepID=A0AAN9YMZ7_9PEZI